MKRINIHALMKPTIFYVSAIIVMTMFIQVVACLAIVHGSSMENTLNDGDIMLVWQLAYQPRQGDIILINKNNPLGVNLIKRVVAVAGQHIKISNGKIYIDGVLLNEPYIKGVLWKKNEYELVVPDGFIYLLGDNRDFSKDSREIGCIEVSTVIGEVHFRIFPFTNIRKIV